MLSDRSGAAYFAPSVWNAGICCDVRRRELRTPGVLGASTPRCDTVQVPNESVCATLQRVNTAPKRTRICARTQTLSTVVVFRYFCGFAWQIKQATRRLFGRRRALLLYVCIGILARKCTE